VCDLETSKIGAQYIYICIYDIRILSVIDLTFILLTWRKWGSPNNTSKWQMGFNSAFKELMFPAYWTLLLIHVALLVNRNFISELGTG
jgi:hypothetical protein